MPQDASQDIQSRFSCPDSDTALRVYGVSGANLRILGRTFGVRLYPAGTEVLIRGTEKQVEALTALLEQLVELAQTGISFTEREIRLAASAVKKDSSVDLRPVLARRVLTTRKGLPVSPKTPAQDEYVSAILSHTLTFGIGPAGTGKTYLAMAVAISQLMSRAVSRIILTRPAVEAGERLGFLPGDLVEKVNPYLRPLYDALHDMVDPERAASLMEHGRIEVAPLAFMRGRTLKDSFVILDEAQNTTPAQMKMFLTRIGEGSKIVVTGDVTQVDLPSSSQSGLLHAIDVLNGVRDIAVVRLTSTDVVRHPLVQRIIDAYELNERSEMPRNSGH